MESRCEGIGFLANVLGDCLIAWHSQGKLPMPSGWAGPPGGRGRTTILRAPRHGYPDQPFGPTFPALIAAGGLPPGVPEDFGYVVDEAQRQSQAGLAQLVPGSSTSRGPQGPQRPPEAPVLVADAITASSTTSRPGFDDRICHDGVSTATD